VTLGTLQSAIEERYDLDTSTSTSFISSGLMISLINEAISSLYAMLMQTRPDEYCTFEETISAPANTATFDLSTLSAASFVDLRAVYWLRANNDPVEIEAGTLEDFHKRSMAAEAWDERVTYCVIRDELYWLPIPSTTQSLRVVYVGMPTPLAISADTVLLQPGWEQFIVYDVCLKLALKEERDTGLWERERETARIAVLSQRERNKGNAKGRGRQIRDRRGTRERLVWPYKWRDL
jgi:hypothetical protein